MAGGKQIVKKKTSSMYDEYSTTPYITHVIITVLKGPAKFVSDTEGPYIEGL